jgi:hypothetical protein
VSDHIPQRLAVRQSAAHFGLELLQRAVALVCLAQGVLYWMRLVGVYPSGQWRFDLLPLYWQTAAGSLAVLFPFASVGLWTLASWGPVIWFVCAAAEIIMFGLMSDLYGFKPWIIAGHLLAGGSYVTLRVMIHLEKRRSDN